MSTIIQKAFINSINRGSHRRTMAEINNQLRILALHGFYQSDVAFRAKIGSLRKALKKDAEFTFLKAPHRIRRPNGDENAEEYGWWFNNTNTEFKAKNTSAEAVGFEESLLSVERIFAEKGPFDGILGFSQGAAFVAILCAIQQKKLSSIRFNFAIMISGFKSRCGSHSIFYDDRLDIPSLHVYGTTDEIIPTEMAEDLAALFTDATKSTHDGGHYVPGNKNLYKEFVQNMATIKANSPR